MEASLDSLAFSYDDNGAGANLSFGILEQYVFAVIFCAFLFRTYARGFLLEFLSFVLIVFTPCFIASFMIAIVVALHSYEVTHPRFMSSLSKSKVHNLVSDSLVRYNSHINGEISSRPYTQPIGIRLSMYVFGFLQKNTHIEFFPFV